MVERWLVVGQSFVVWFDAEAPIVSGREVDAN
jgi:hypothetical protein